MKVGDYITCIKTGEMVDSDEVFAYKGKQYPITRITNQGFLDQRKTKTKTKTRITSQDFLEV